MNTADRPRQTAWSTPRWMRLALKELREILRDRRTILTLVLMPILVYPLIGVAFQKLLVNQLMDRQKVEYHIGVETADQYRALQQLMSQGGNLLRADGSVSGDADHPAGTLDDPVVQILAPPEGTRRQSVDQLVAERIVDVGVRLSSVDSEQGREPQWRVELLTHPAFPAAREARQFVEDRLRAVNNEQLQQRLQYHQLNAQPAIVIEQRQIHTEPGNGPSFSLATLVPLVLLLMTVTGAVYPAIDLTAGERERGTMEPLMAAPVPRHQLLMGKYVAVLTVALLTAIANLVAMVATMYGTGLQSVLFGPQGITPLLFAQVLCLLLVFAGFFSAVLLTLTSFARSFKEAQAYLIPLMLLSLAPGILSLMPGLEITPWLAITPLANIVLVGRDLLESRLQPGMGFLALASTLLYAIAALLAASRIFGADALTFGGGSWTNLIERPRDWRLRPSFVEAGATLAVLFPGFVLISGVPASLDAKTWTFGERLMVSSLIPIVLFIGVPWATSLWRRIRPRTGFQLVSPPILAWPAALLLGVSLWSWAYELELMTLSTERINALKSLFESIQADLASVPLPVKLLALAIVPACTEELFFRGWLLGAMRGRFTATAAIVLSAVAFGLFHILVRDALMFERMVPSTMLGLALGWVCWRSQSVWPGMLLHALHNGLLLSLETFQERLADWGLGMTERTHLPATWLLGSGVLCLAGISLLVFTRPRNLAGDRESNTGGEPAPVA